MGEQATFDPNAFGTSEGIASLAAKLAEVMGALDRIPKSGHNDHFNYDFARESDVLNAVRKELATRKVTCLPYLEDASSSIEGKMRTAVTRYRFTFYDGDTGASIIARVQSEGSDTQDKSSSKALTSALKAFLLKAFLIPTGDDPDADTPRPARATASRSAPTPRPVGDPGRLTTQDLSRPASPQPTSAPAPTKSATAPSANGTSTLDHQALLTKAVRLWGKNVKVAKAFADLNELGPAMNLWSTDDLALFCAEMEKAESTAPASHRA